MTVGRAKADTPEAIEHNLTNHPPVNDEVVAQFEAIRKAAKQLGVAIVTICPETRERSLAITNLEQTVMWAVASIARYQDGE